MSTMKSVILLRVGNWLLLGLALIGLSAFAAAQSDAPAPPPPPPHDMNVTFGGGPGMGFAMAMGHDGMEEGKAGQRCAHERRDGRYPRPDAG